jgi:ABC-2 type transport system permease protein
MNAFSRHFLYEFKVGLRDRSLLLMNYLFPLGVYVLFGLLLTGLNPTFAPTMIPAMILIAMMSSALLGMPNPLVESREAGIFRSFKINGVPAISILRIPMISSFLHIVLVSLIITITAGPFFHAGIPTQWGYFILVFVITALAMNSLGILIGVVSSNSRSTILYSQLIFLPSMILGGLMVPTSMLTPILFRVSLLLPTTYAMDAWQALAFGMQAPFSAWAALAILLASGVLSLGLSMYLFTWDSKNRRTGRSSALALLVLLPYLLGAIFLFKLY